MSRALPLLAVALVLIAGHTLTNHQYGFHRDELATLDDARHLAWGFVAYPPVTPFLGRVELTLFGTSLAGFRFFAAVAQGLVAILAGLIAREMGGKRLAQLLAAIATAIGPVAMSSGALFQYVAFDYLWWVLAAWCAVVLMNRRDPRWWVALGAVFGLGLLTKYTMGVAILGIVAALLTTGARRDLRTRWPWIGAAVALFIFHPNVHWQVHNNFVSLEFLNFIHARDVRAGRTAGFVTDQFLICINPFTIPLWIGGLIYALRARPKPWFRALVWMFFIPCALLLAAKGRGYYLAPAYAPLLAAGAVQFEEISGRISPRYRAIRRAGLLAGLAAGAVLAIAMVVPIAPVNSGWWKTASMFDGDFREEIGWPDLVAAIARIRDTVPAEERAHLAILAGNYGEAGAIGVYGPAYGLPTAISGINSFWARGYGDPPPETVIAVGFSRRRLERSFESCELAGHNTNSFGIRNEESADHPDIFICRRPRRPWPEMWREFRSFG